MADSGDDSFPVPDSPLQEAFDQEAGDLGLRAEPRVGPLEMALCAEGGFFQSVDVGEATPAPIDATDDDAIRSVVQGYESLDSTTFSGQWRNFTVDPYVVLGPSWVAQVNEQVIQGGLAAASPRRLVLTDLRIVYIGEARAVATYQVEEDRDGQATVGNRACLLFRVHNAGWRIAVATYNGASEASGSGR